MPSKVAYSTSPFLRNVTSEAALSSRLIALFMAFCIVSSLITKMQESWQVLVYTFFTILRLGGLHLGNFRGHRVILFCRNLKKLVLLLDFLNQLGRHRFGLPVRIVDGHN